MRPPRSLRAGGAVHRPHQRDIANRCWPGATAMRSASGSPNTSRQTIWSSTAISHQVRGGLGSLGRSSGSECQLAVYVSIHVDAVQRRQALRREIAPKRCAETPQRRDFRRKFRRCWRGRWRWGQRHGRQAGPAKAPKPQRATPSVEQPSAATLGSFLEFFGQRCVASVLFFARP